jgi:hypothetical protein
MLSIMSLAFQGAGSNELARRKGDSPEESRKKIFSLYVEQMFRRKGTPSRAFPKEKVIGWLSWLARKMREHSQSVFLIEGLQPSWLCTRAQRVVYRALGVLSIGLIGRLIYGLICGLSKGLLVGLIIGLTFRLLFALLLTPLFALVDPQLKTLSDGKVLGGFLLAWAPAALIYRWIYGRADSSRLGSLYDSFCRDGQLEPGSAF